MLDKISCTTPAQSGEDLVTGQSISKSESHGELVP